MRMLINSLVLLSVQGKTQAAKSYCFLHCCNHEARANKKIKIWETTAASGGNFSFGYLIINTIDRAFVDEWNIFAILKEMYEYVLALIYSIFVATFSLSRADITITTLV